MVKRADFDGDGRDDLAIGLAAKTNRVPLVVAALARDRSWAISPIRSWVGDINRLYVRSAPPGLLKRTEALDGPIEPDERTSLRCNRTAVVVGATESTAIAYCYLETRWFYVWISD